MKEVLVLGIGNLLMGDEGIGVHIAQRMELLQLPSYLKVMDGGTGGFYLMSYLESYNDIIVIDATLDKHPVGTIRLLTPRFSNDFPPAMSTHDIGLKDMVSALQFMDKMPNIHLFAVTIESLQQQGIHLTPEIEAIVPNLIEQITALSKQISAN